MHVLSNQVNRLKKERKKPISMNAYNFSNQTDNLNAYFPFIDEAANK